MRGEKTCVSRGLFNGHDGIDRRDPSVGSINIADIIVVAVHLLCTPSVRAISARRRLSRTYRRNTV